MPIKLKRKLADVAVTYREHTFEVPDTCPGCDSPLTEEEQLRVAGVTEAYKVAEVETYKGKVQALTEDGTASLYEKAGIMLDEDLSNAGRLSLTPCSVTCECGHVFAAGTYSNPGEGE